MKKLLIVVDMQKDFVDGALGSEEAVAIVDNVVNKIESFDGDIIVTYDTHFENYMETQEGKNDPAELEIELIGLCTDICVVSNALLMKATFLETKVSVDASCCAGVTVDSHNAALATMKMCQVNVIEK